MIRAHNIVKEFGEPAQRIIDDITIDINEGEFVSIAGRSGSGKSTLLYIISTLDNPTHGIVEINNRVINNLSVDQVHEFRNKNIGFIFQFHYLLPELTALENILLPPMNSGVQKQYKKGALELLERLNITHIANKMPGQMSGGEQQRVAIARALIMNPKYIFADEPTGNLDSTNAQIVMDILKEVNKENGTTISLVTHDREFSKMADREIFLVDGKLSDTYL